MAILTFGPRSVFGFFLQPMSQELGWGRDVFALAVAIQNLLWGVALPFAGAVADRYGSLCALAVGGVIYAAGLALMAYSTTPGMLHLSAGVLVGFGLAGASFTIVLAAFGKLLPELMRTFAFGVGTAAGSFGQFLFSPLAVALLDSVGWQQTLLMFAVLVLLVLPLALAVATPAMDMGVGATRNRNRSARRSAKPSAINPTCCWCSASSPAASTSPSSRCICRPIWSIAGSTCRGAAGCSPSSACSTSWARSRPACSAAGSRSAICSR